MELLIATLISLSIFFAGQAVFRRVLRPSMTTVRLDNIGADARESNAFDGDSRPVNERLLRPLAGWVTGTAATLLPTRLVARAEQRLIRAGNPMRPTTYFAMSLGVALTSLFLALLVWIEASAATPFIRLFLALFPAVLGIAGPNVWLNGRVTRREQRIQRELPDALDLIIVSVEAGLGLEGAMARVAESGDGPFALELRRVLSEMNLGVGRRRAMQGLAARTGIPSIRSLVAAILQADQTGMGIGNVLRAQAEHLRMQRRQAAEEAAMKAPLKMLFPLVLFIFPSLFVVVLAPAVLALMKAMSGA